MADVTHKLPTGNLSSQPTDIRDRPNAQTQIDLSDIESLESLKDELLRTPVFLQEQNRGTIGKMIIAFVAVLIFLLPFVGGLIAAFGSASQAQAYNSAVVTILGALTGLVAVSWVPVITYYFVRRRK